MSRVILKTDYEDGQVLHGSELNINNNVAMLGINDNFDRINNLNTNKANIIDVENALSGKVDLAVMNNRFREMDILKADKSSIATKAEQSEVDKKADRDVVNAALETKADLNYVETNLNTKVNNSDFTNALNLKSDKVDVGDLRQLKTEVKSSIVGAINSINLEATPIATIDKVGLVKPDGTTTTIDQDGTLHAIGGGETGTKDYNEVYNKPQINSVELKGNISLEDLDLYDVYAIDNMMDEKADITNVYSKDSIDTEIKVPLSNKADKSYVDNKLAEKADAENVYNKTTIDSKFEATTGETDAKLLSKADAENVYNKEQVDNKVKVKADNLSFSENHLQLKSGEDLIGEPVEIKVSGTEVLVQPDEPSDDEWKIWIDSGQVSNLGSEVVDSMSGEQSNVAPSVKAVKEYINVYTYTEKKVGKWVNGKDLYSKVVTGNTGSTTGNYEVDIEASNIDDTAFFIAHIYDTNNSKHSIGFYNGTTYIRAYFNPRRVGISIGGNIGNFGNCKYEIIIFYTKK